MVYIVQAVIAVSEYDDEKKIKILINSLVEQRRSSYWLG